MSKGLSSRLPDVGTTIFTVMSALANAHGAVNLSQGFPDFDCDARLKALVDKHIRAGHNQYAPMQGIPALREALAQKIESQHQHAYHPEKEVCITAGATQAIFTAAMALIHPGDEVIIVEPAYDSYGPSIALAGGETKRVEIDLEKQDLDTAAIAEAISEKTRLIILNSPHNPTGICFSKTQMLALEDLLSDTDILLLSDEVYEHIVFDGAEHESVARYPGLRERAVLISSLGKTYHNTGWKLGYVMAPEYIMKEFLKVHQFNVFCVNRPLQMAFADFMRDDSSHTALPDFYQKKRDYFCSGIGGSRFSFSPAAGTYFQMLDYSAISDEENIELAKRWTKDEGIASIPIASFYQDAPNRPLLRFCFAKNDETLDKGMEILNRL